MNLLRNASILAIALTTLLAAPAGATNGMSLSGYGPISAAMGGASMAFGNGTAAVMNNPATLAFMRQGSRIDVAFGALGPDVKATVTTPGGALSAGSSMDAFYMPALGWAMKRGNVLFGLAMFGQGGMGTEYSATSWMSDPSQGANTALTSGLVNRSEVSVGRVLVPVTYSINDRLGIGVTADFVWAGMDLQMAMSEAQFGDLASTHNAGTASGTLVNAFGMMYEPFGGTGIAKLHHAYFDFSNSSDFTGEAMGVGFAGKVGVVYRIFRDLTLGATFHSKTFLGDLETDNATMTMGVSIDPGVAQGGAPTGSYVDMNIPVTGKITVNDFQWPASVGLGAAYHATDRLLIAADFKQVFWSGVMDQFSMTFVADNSQENGGFASQQLDAVLYQEWADQTVISVGAEFLPIDELALRVGYNMASNPVPNEYLNALFPAIIEKHVTFGAGYRITESTTVNMAVVKALEAEFTNPGNGSTVPPVTSTHSQLNWQIMVTHCF